MSAFVSFKKQSYKSWDIGDPNLSEVQIQNENRNYSENFSWAKIILVLIVSHTKRNIKTSNFIWVLQIYQMSNVSSSGWNSFIFQVKEVDEILN